MHLTSGHDARPDDDGAMTDSPRPVRLELNEVPSNGFTETSTGLKRAVRRLSGCRSISTAGGRKDSSAGEGWNVCRARVKSRLHRGGGRERGHGGARRSAPPSEEYTPRWRRGSCRLLLPACRQPSGFHHRQTQPVCGSCTVFYVANSSPSGDTVDTSVYSQHFPNWGYRGFQCIQPTVPQVGIP